MGIVWLGMAFIGAVASIFSILSPVAGVVGGSLAAFAIVMQYIDSRPVERVLGTTAWTTTDNGEYRTRFTGWRVRGKRHAQVFLEDGEEWQEALAEVRLDHDGTLVLAVAKPIRAKVYIRA
jgi:hypothetical protein